MSIKTNYYKVGMLLLVALIIILLLTVYLNWQTLFMFSQQLQRQFHQTLTLFLTQVASHPLKTGLLLTGLSLIYGIAHSAGPGHGKFIITTYLATQPSKLKRSLYLTLLSAIMQGIVAILLVTLLLVIFRLSASQVTKSEYWLTFSSYLVVILMGMLICYQSLAKLLGVLSRANKNDQLKIVRLLPLTQTSMQTRMTITQPMLPLSELRLTNSEPLHHHHLTAHGQKGDGVCGCGHRHLLTTNELNQKSHWYNDLAVIISIGMRPCSGALLVLLFSHIIGVYSWGIIATLAMSIGTAITTSCFALLVYFARKVAERLAQQQLTKNRYRMQFFTYFIAVLGGILFVIMGLLLIMGLKMQAESINPLFN